jgi:hypothetical protein
MLFGAGRRAWPRKNRCNPFVTNDTKENWLCDQKELDSRPRVSIVAPPSSNVPNKSAETKEVTIHQATVPSQQTFRF